MLPPPHSSGMKYRWVGENGKYFISIIFTLAQQQMQGLL